MTKNWHFDIYYCQPNDYPRKYFFPSWASLRNIKLGYTSRYANPNFDIDKTLSSHCSSATHFIFHCQCYQVDSRLIIKLFILRWNLEQQKYCLFPFFSFQIILQQSPLVETRFCTKATLILGPNRCEVDVERANSKLKLITDKANLIMKNSDRWKHHICHVAVSTVTLRKKLMT